MIIATHGIVASQIASYVGLLDLYPSAAAAYSLRKLRSAYTGSAIRVRRSSDNTEQDIGFSATGGLDSSALTSFCGSGNGFVTTWYDQSGNSRNATQTTAANQPQIVSSGSIYTNIGGLPTIRTDGSNDNLISTSFTSISQPLTLFLIQQWISITNIYPYLVDIGIDRALGYISGSSNKNEMYFGSTLASSVSISLGTNNLWYALANGTSSQISLNNSVVTTGNSGTGSANQITIGSRGGSTVHASTYISEFIFYPLNQSSNRTGIETNINSYYGIY